MLKHHTVPLQRSTCLLPPHMQILHRAHQLRLLELKMSSLQMTPTLIVILTSWLLLTPLDQRLGAPPQPNQAPHWMQLMSPVKPLCQERLAPVDVPKNVPRGSVRYVGRAVVSSSPTNNAPQKSEKQAEAEVISTSMY